MKKSHSKMSKTQLERYRVKQSCVKCNGVLAYDPWMDKNGEWVPEIQCQDCGQRYCVTFQPRGYIIDA